MCVSNCLQNGHSGDCVALHWAITPLDCHPAVMVMAKILRCLSVKCSKILLAVQESNGVGGTPLRCEISLWQCQSHAILNSFLMALLVAVWILMRNPPGPSNVAPGVTSQSRRWMYAARAVAGPWTWPLYLRRDCTKLLASDGWYTNSLRNVVNMSEMTYSMGS